MWQTELTFAKSAIIGRYHSLMYISLSFCLVWMMTCLKLALTFMWTTPATSATTGCWGWLAPVTLRSSAFHSTYRTALSPSAPTCTPVTFLYCKKKIFVIVIPSKKITFYKFPCKIIISDFLVNLHFFCHFTFFLSGSWGNRNKTQNNIRIFLFPVFRVNLTFFIHFKNYIKICLKNSKIPEFFNYRREICKRITFFIYLCIDILLHNNTIMHMIIL